MEWDSDPTKYPAYWRRKVKLGFGLGKGVDYKSWLRVRDVPSRGTSGTPKGITVPRVYHLLSTPERIYFHLLDRQPDVVDIREQWPILDIVATQTLCARLGVRHPRWGRYPIPFTIDFVVTRKMEDGTLIFQGRSVKTVADAGQSAVRELLNVEYLWCDQIGIDWKLVETDNFTDDLLATLTFLRGWSQQRYEPNAASLKQFLRSFNTAYAPNVPLKELVGECAGHLKRGFNQTLNEFRYAAWSDRVPIDLQSKLALHLPVVLYEDA